MYFARARGASFAAINRTRSRRSPFGSLRMPPDLDALSPHFLAMLWRLALTEARPSLIQIKLAAGDRVHAIRDKGREPGS
jgi:hypothetical protein